MSRISAIVIFLLTLLPACAGERSLVDSSAAGEGTFGEGISSLLDGRSPAADSSQLKSDHGALLGIDRSVVACGEFAGMTRFTCSKDGYSRGKCVNGAGVIESCARGCLRGKAPADDVCMGTTDNWSCTGIQGTNKALNGDYYITYFGCWVDDQGVHHQDPSDNCLPGCFSQAKSAGVCQSSWTGKVCEEKTVYFTANNGRFGCLQHLRIINPANGRKVIAVVLDGGPACSAEQKIQKAMLDTSAPVFNYLFDSGKTWTTKSPVHVIEVDNSTALGIEK
jgi:hypothetical protein